MSGEVADDDFYRKYGPTIGKVYDMPDGTKQIFDCYAGNGVYKTRRLINGEWVRGKSKVIPRPKPKELH